LEKLRAFGTVPHAFLSAPPAAALLRCDDARGNVAGKRLAAGAALLLLGRDRFRRFACGLPRGVALFVGFGDVLEGRQGGSLRCPTGGMKLHLIFFCGNEQMGHFHHADEFRAIPVIVLALGLLGHARRSRSWRRLFVRNLAAAFRIVRPPPKNENRQTCVRVFARDV